MLLLLILHLVDSLKEILMAASKLDVTARSFVDASLPYYTTVLCVDKSLFGLSCYVLCFVIIS
jgi:hypothetical protein